MVEPPTLQQRAFLFLSRTNNKSVVMMICILILHSLHLGIYLNERNSIEVDMAIHRNIENTVAFLSKWWIINNTWTKKPQKTLKTKTKNPLSMNLSYTLYNVVLIPVFFKRKCHNLAGLLLLQSQTVPFSPIIFFLCQVRTKWICKLLIFIA